LIIEKVVSRKSLQCYYLIPDSINPLKIRKRWTSSLCKYCHSQWGTEPSMWRSTAFRWGNA